MRKMCLEEFLNLWIVYKSFMVTVFVYLFMLLKGKYIDRILKKFALEPAIGPLAMQVGG
jgi:hypothetical protein